MNIVTTIPASDCTVTITRAVIKQCPIKQEVDRGVVTITYRTDGEALELHSLVDYLNSFTNLAITHEDYTAQLAEFLHADVRTTWRTAGMEVECAVLRQSVDTTGA